MHELLLHVSLPSSRQHQVLSILTGLAAMQPVPLFEEVQLYKPNRVPEASRSVQVGAVQGVNVPKAQSQMQAAMAGDLFYLRVVREVQRGSKYDNRSAGENEEQAAENDVVSMEVDGGDGDSMEVDVKSPTMDKSRPPAPQSVSSAQGHGAILQFRDVPEAGLQKDRAVTTRFMADIPMIDGSPAAFMKALNYSLVSVYDTDGHRLTYNNIALHLYRVWIPLSQPSLDEVSQKRRGVKQSDMKLLDESGAFVLEARVRVQDGSKVETMARGTAELLALRETLKGVVGLEMVERLALDTRVR